MVKIENLQELEEWAKEVNMGVTTKRKCDLQDVIGRSSMETLKKLFIAANGSRDLILCSLYNTMSYQVVEEMLHHLANHRAQEIIEKEENRLNNEWNEKYALLNKEGNKINESRKTIFKKIRQQRERLLQLESKNNNRKNRIKQLEKEKWQMTENICKLSENSAKYEAIKNLLQ